MKNEAKAEQGENGGTKPRWYGYGSAVIGPDHSHRVARTNLEVFSKGRKDENHDSEDKSKNVRMSSFGYI